MSQFFTFFIIIFIAGLLITMLLMPKPAGKKAAKKALPPAPAKSGKKLQTPSAKKTLAGKLAAQAPPENKEPSKREVQIRVMAFASHCPREAAQILTRWIRSGRRPKTRLERLIK